MDVLYVVMVIVQALVMAAAFVAGMIPNPHARSLAQRLEEAANEFRRLGLLRKHHPDLLRRAKRVPVRRLAKETFTAKHKKDDFDSRGLLLLTDDAVLYWDLGQSTRLEPYVFRPANASATLHLREPYREGEHVWVELECDGTSRYLQCEKVRQVNEETRKLFGDIQAVLHAPSVSA